MSSASHGIILHVLSCILVMGKYVTGSYLRDVELIGPSQAELNTVYYYPSYVKGEDPVEEYNRRRLHVDTANFMEYEANQKRHNEQQQAHTRPAGDECCMKVKRKRKYDGRVRHPKQHAIDPMRVVDAQTDHEYNYKKIRQAGRTGAPRYVRDDVEIFDIDRGNRIKAKRPIRRRSRRAHETRTAKQPRYEESDPQIFAYERSDVLPSGRENTDRAGTTQDNQYFQDTFQYQKSPLELEFGHLFESNNGWEERYERQDHQNHRHQGK
uniref:Secreted protein n=1 Tax=Anopheles culicifacies TaxID=139723 RepID=A0A182MAJ9_9DIPT